jgi:hypothetical protein
VRHVGLTALHPDARAVALPDLLTQLASRRRTPASRQR